MSGKLSLSLLAVVSVLIVSSSVGYAVSVNSVTVNTGNSLVPNYCLLVFTDGTDDYSINQNLKDTFTLNGASVTITNGYQLKYQDTDTITDSALLTMKIDGLASLVGAMITVHIGAQSFSAPIPSTSEFTIGDMCIETTTIPYVASFSIVITPYGGQSSITISSYSIEMTAYHVPRGSA